LCQKWVHKPLAPYQTCPFIRSHLDVLCIEVYIKSDKSNVAAVVDGLLLKEREGEEGEGKEQQSHLNAYTMFKYSICTELTRKYYERRLRRFFDFIQFEVEIKDIEKRSNDFDNQIYTATYVYLLTYKQDNNFVKI
jgi:hypothetical protein